MKLLFLTESSSSKKPQRVHSIEELAESLSQYSNRPDIFQVSLNVTNSWMSMAALLITTFYKPWETDGLVKHIANMAYQKNYEGQWKTVQELLETGLQSPEEFQRRFCELRAPEEFFGNLLPAAGRLAKIMLLKNLQQKNNRKVKRKVRHRGYRDKGSLRFSHERHGEAPSRKEHTEDRRSRVAHPLVRLEFGEYFGSSS